VVFRITAVAKGRKPETTVVLQETYARQRTKD
jgi:type IV pilus assembly protein PilX